MSGTVTIAHNAVTAKLIDPSQDVKAIVQDRLSYRVDGFEHMAAFKGSAWHGRASFFEFMPGTFPRGFVELVRNVLTRRGYKVNVVKKPYPEALGPAHPVVDNFGDDPRYAYQRQVVDSVLKHGQIVAQVATGGGKSRIAKIAHARIGRRTLFLTTRSILMHQMRGSFLRDMGVRVGVFGDGEWTRPELMNVGMVQTLIEKIELPEVQSLLQSFEFVILEEAHESSSNSYYDILRCCKNAHYRLALTATPFMKDSEEANMRLMAGSGPIAVRVSEKHLIELGILAKPYFRFLDVPQNPKLFRSTPWPKCYEVGIVKDQARNEMIVKEVRKAIRYGLNGMILIQRREHGETLSRMLTEAGIRTNFIWGEHDQADRQAALNALKNGVIDVLIGSTILDVGVDVPSVGMVILAGGGKAEVALRQRIGRGLRAKKDGPNVCFVLDFSDKGNNHLKTHARNRREIIESTEGFAENIIGGEFPFEALGFRPKVTAE